MPHYSQREIRVFVMQILSLIRDYGTRNFRGKHLRALDTMNTDLFLIHTRAIVADDSFWLGVKPALISPMGLVLRQTLRERLRVILS